MLNIGADCFFKIHITEDYSSKKYYVKFAHSHPYNTDAILISGQWSKVFGI